MRSYGANRMELKDQIVIKAKLDQKGDKTKLVSHFGEAKNVKKKRGEEKKKRKKKKRKGMETMCVWMAMILYG